MFLRLNPGRIKLLKIIFTILALVILLAALVPFGSPVSAQGSQSETDKWVKEVVHSGTYTDLMHGAGWYCSLDFYSDGRAAIGYTVDAEADYVYYAEWDGEDWSKVLVDALYQTTYDQGFYVDGPISLAIDERCPNAAAIAYWVHRKQRYPSPDWVEMRYVESPWSVPSTLDTIDDITYHNNEPISLAYDNRIAHRGDPPMCYRGIAYYDADEQAIVYRHRSGTAWGDPVVVGDGLDPQWSYTCSLGFDREGAAHIAYSGHYLDYLRHVKITADAQLEQTWEGMEALSCSLAFDRNGNPAIACGTLTSLQYVEHDGTQWSAPVEVSSDNAYYCSLAFDRSGNPAIAYYDTSENNLKFVYRTDGEWQDPVTVDDEGNVGESCSLAFDRSGNAGIAYHDRTHKALKFAFRDLTPPTVEIDPLTSDLTSDSTPMFRITVTDTHTPVSSVEYRMDSGEWMTVPIVPAKSVSYTEEVTDALGDGNHILEVRATDDVGNVDSRNWKFVVDTSPPELTVNEFKYDRTDSSRPTIRGTAEDSNSVQWVQCRLVDADGSEEIGWSDADANDGAFDSSFEHYTFETPAPGLDDGQYTLEVRAADNLDNSTPAGDYQTYTFTVSTQGPNVQVAGPVRTSDTTPQLSGSAWSTMRPIASVEYRLLHRVHEGDYQTTHSDWVLPPSLGPYESSEDFTFVLPQLTLDGEYIFKVWAADDLGAITPEESYGSHTFILDTKGPGVDITPLPADSSDVSTPTLSGTVTDDYSPIDVGSVQYDVDGQDNWKDADFTPDPADGKTGTFTFTIPDPLQTGQHTVEVRAKDDLQNETDEYETYTFTVQAATPIVTIAELTPDPINNNTPTLSGSVMGSCSIVSVEYQVHGAQYWSAATLLPDDDDDPTTRAFTVTIPDDQPLNEGSCTVDVRATDEAENISTSYDSDTFVVDTVPPVASFNALPDDTTSDSTPTLMGTVSDVTTSVALVEYQVDQGAWTPAEAVDGTFDGQNEEFRFTTYLDDGPHTLYVRATDAAENVNQEPYESISLTVGTEGGGPWAIIGGVIGGVILLAGVGVAAYLIWRKRRRAVPTSDS